MRKTLLAVLLSLSLQGFSQVETDFPVALPETVGLSSKGLIQGNNMMLGYVDRRQLPGMIMRSKSLMIWVISSLSAGGVAGSCAKISPGFTFDFTV